MPEGQERPGKIPPHDLPGSGPNHRYLMGLRQAVASCGGLWWAGVWRPVGTDGNGWQRTAPPIIQGQKKGVYRTSSRKSNKIRTPNPVGRK